MDTASPSPKRYDKQTGLALRRGPSQLQQPTKPPLPTSDSHRLYRTSEAELGSPSDFAIRAPSNNVTMLTAALDRDGQPRRIGIARLSQPVLPAPEALNREGPGAGADADTDPVMVGGHGA